MDWQLLSVLLSMDFGCTLTEENLFHVRVPSYDVEAHCSQCNVDYIIHSIPLHSISFLSPDISGGGLLK